MLGAGMLRMYATRIDDRIAGREEAKPDFSKVDTSKLTLVDTSAMDESVLTGNIKRSVENACQEELLTLNRGMGHLLGRPVAGDWNATMREKVAALDLTDACHDADRVQPAGRWLLVVLLLADGKDQAPGPGRGLPRSC